jgi:hypothetical protein
MMLNIRHALDTARRPVQPLVRLAHMGGKVVLSSDADRIFFGRGSIVARRRKQSIVS